MDHYPDNQASHFYTNLPQAVNLSGDYEVGLSEIQFPNSFSNVEEGTCWMRFRTSNLAAQHEERLPGGLYESAEYFIHVLNTFVKKHADGKNEQPGKIKFYYNKASKKAKITLWGRGPVVILSPALQELLKMPMNVFHGPTRVEGTAMMSLHEDFSSVYVYCDLVEQRPVGDVMVPLLRIVPIINKTEDIVHCLYEKPHYVSLSRYQFNTVEILLATDTGKPISFDRGKTIVTLHLRRKRPENY